MAGKLGWTTLALAVAESRGAKTLLSVVSAVALLVLLVCLILAVISLVQRYRRAVGEERARFKWFVYGVSVLIGSFLLNIVLSIFFVVGALAVFVTVVYAALVVGIGPAVVGSRSNTFLTLLAAVVIAVAFQPVQTRAQRFANRLVFGKRATPYEVLSEFADRVGHGYDGEDLLQQMAETVGEGVGGSAAYVWLRVGSELQAAGAWPNEARSSDRGAAGLAPAYRLGLRRRAPAHRAQHPRRRAAATRRPGHETPAGQRARPSRSGPGRGNARRRSRRRPGCPGHSARPGPRHLPTAAAAYFCCLEAMQNSAKHGGGAPVTISLGGGGGTLTFRVADTGAGFDPDCTKRGSGLQNMQDRLEALGGSVEIDSRPSEGTVVFGRIPVLAG
jgi:signal transduction histidine kinase